MSGGFQWGHINVNVSDLERSIAFYELLGFKLFMPAIPYFGLERGEARSLEDGHADVLGVPRGTTGRACIVQLDDGFPKLDLTALDCAAPAQPLGTQDLGVVRICLACADLAAEVARLEAAGVGFLTPSATGTAGLVEVALCRDPDGTLIELLQIYPQRWAALGA